MEGLTDKIADFVEWGWNALLGRDEPAAGAKPQKKKPDPVSVEREREHRRNIEEIKRQLKELEEKGGDDPRIIQLRNRLRMHGLLRNSYKSINQSHFERE